MSQGEVSRLVPSEYLYSRLEKQKENHEYSRGECYLIGRLNKGVGRVVTHKYLKDLKERKLAILNTTLSTG